MSRAAGVGVEKEKWVRTLEKGRWRKQVLVACEPLEGQRLFLLTWAAVGREWGDPGGDCCLYQVQTRVEVET